jgi:hypothetical protein
MKIKIFLIKEKYIHLTRENKNKKCRNEPTWALGLRVVGLNCVRFKFEREIERKNIYQLK